MFLRVVGSVLQPSEHILRCRAPFSAAAMWHSALLGAVLLVVADYAAMRVLAPFQIPVGLATGAVGGVYMLWLLRKVR